MKIYYRISNNSFKKERLLNATKIKCLTNFLSSFYDGINSIEIIADNVTDIDLQEKLTGLNDGRGIVVKYTSLGNVQSFKHVFNKALELDPNEYVYFVEDDYFHRENSSKVMLEGLECADYVTLYDHPDKYWDNADNPFIECGGEVTRVILTESTHWKLTNSTTMTFASKVSTLLEDKEIFYKGLIDDYPKDFHIFCMLRDIKNRSLISPIPGYSTHGEVKYQAPLIDWSKY
jgi:hypothetical protein